MSASASNSAWARSFCMSGLALTKNAVVAQRFDILAGNFGWLRIFESRQAVDGMFKVLVLEWPDEDIVCSQADRIFPVRRRRLRGTAG